MRLKSADDSNVIEIIYDILVSVSIKAPRGERAHDVEGLPEANGRWPVTRTPAAISGTVVEVATGGWHRAVERWSPGLLGVDDEGYGL